MSSKQTIILYLTKSQTCIDSALRTTEKGDNESAQRHITKAIFQLRAAIKLMIHEHIAKCIPKIMKESSVNQGIEEILKTRKYIPS